MRAEQLIDRYLEGKRDVRKGGNAPPPSQKQQRAKLSMQQGKKRADLFKRIEKEFGITRKEWFKLDPDKQSEILSKL